MARRWVALTAARTNPVIAINTIIEYTEWAGRTAAADEIIHSDPVDSSDDPVDSNWKVGGTVTLASGVYTYADPSGEGAPHDITAALGQKRAAVMAAWDQLDRWEDDLLANGRGQPSAIRNLGHDLILGQRKALYLVALAATVSVAGIQSYSEQIAQGSSDITDVPTFYRLAAALTKGSWVDGDPLQWATIAGNVATRRTLQTSITQAPTDFRANVRDFSNVDLGNGKWIRSAITS